MFVSKSKYDKLKAELDFVTIKYNQIDSQLFITRTKWNKLVQLINSKGGQQFLDDATIGGQGQFTDEELRSLLQLVHPDKHGGKASAVRLTQKINQLRK